MCLSLNKLACLVCVWIAILFVCVSITNAEQPERGYLVHLPGVAGETVLDRWMLQGLTEGGVTSEMVMYDWTGKDPGIRALLSRKKNEQHAQIVADQITQVYRADPTRPIQVTAHSGGTGIAVWALEKLPEDVVVESVLLLAPALSPEYDLSRALRHVRLSMFAFTSRYDIAVLGAGTRLFGTIDGVKSDAAGLVGFVRPDSADRTQYVKLVAMPYDAEWVDIGNIGDHIGPMSEEFAKEFLAPILLTGNVPAPATQPISSSPGGRR